MAKNHAKVGPEDPTPRESAPPDFVGFFHKAYRAVMQTVLYAGATYHEAEEAAAAGLEEVLRRWDQIRSPLAYARRAALTSFLKEKERGPDRVRHRMAAHAEARQEGTEDAGLTIWEDRQWVAQILSSLPPAQREVMAFITDGFTPAEIATMLGKTPDAVRQNLHAARTRLTLELHGPPQGTHRTAPPPHWPEGGPDDQRHAQPATRTPRAGRATAP
jgi:RNA polymerase sigma-70 factor (ECF subfamily)